MPRKIGTAQNPIKMQNMQGIIINLSRPPPRPPRPPNRAAAGGVLNEWFPPSSTTKLINNLKRATTYIQIFQLTEHLSNKELNKITRRLTLNNDQLSFLLGKVRHEKQQRQKIINSKSFGNYIKEVSEPNYYQDPRTKRIYISTGVRNSNFGKLYKKYNPEEFKKHYNELSTNNIARKKKENKGY